MAENPLLPNAELQALLTLTRRCARLDAAARRRGPQPPARRADPPPLPSREAFLAGTALQLRPGDLLIGEPGDQTATTLAPRSEISANYPPSLVPEMGRKTPRILLAAAMAETLRACKTDRLVLVYVRDRAAEPDWPAALAWAQDRQLPLIVACADPRGKDAFTADARAPKGTFSWAAVTQTASRLKLPILTLDGEDAVAVCRAMQESELRARSGAGPAILWSLLPNPKAMALRPKSAEPLGRLQRYLRSRKIPFGSPRSP